MQSEAASMVDQWAGIEFVWIRSKLRLLYGKHASGMAQAHLQPLDVRRRRWPGGERIRSQRSPRDGRAGHSGGDRGRNDVPLQRRDKGSDSERRVSAFSSAPANSDVGRTVVRACEWKARWNSASRKLRRHRATMATRRQNRNQFADEAAPHARLSQVRYSRAWASYFLSCHQRAVVKLPHARYDCGLGRKSKVRLELRIGRQSLHRRLRLASGAAPSP